MVTISLHPDGSCSLEQVKQSATKVKRHDLISGPHQLLTNEDRRDRPVPAQKTCELHLHIPSSWDLIELINRRADPKIIEESLDGVAHAA